MYGGVWERAGPPHKDRKDIYVAKDKRYENIYSGKLLDDEITMRRELLSEFDMPHFENIPNEIKILVEATNDPDYMLYIPWNIHYTFNKWGYGHMTYDKLIYENYQNKNALLIQVHMGYGNTPDDLENCGKTIKLTKECKQYVWFNITDNFINMNNTYINNQTIYNSNKYEINENDIINRNFNWTPILNSFNKELDQFYIDNQELIGDKMLDENINYSELLDIQKSLIIAYDEFTQTIIKQGDTRRSLMADNIRLATEPSEIAGITYPPRLSERQYYDMDNKRHDPLVFNKENMDIVSKYIELRDKSQLEYDKELIKAERKSKKKEWKLKKQQNAAKTMQKRFRGNKSRNDLSIKRNDEQMRQEQMMEQMRLEQMMEHMRQEQMMEQMRQTYQEPIYYSPIQNLQQPPSNEYYYDQRFQQQVIFDYNTQTYYDLYGTPL